MVSTCTGTCPDTTEGPWEPAWPSLNGVPLIHTQGVRNAQQLQWEGLMLNFGRSRYTLIAEAINVKLQLWVGSKQLLDSCAEGRSIDACLDHSVRSHSYPGSLVATIILKRHRLYMIYSNMT